MKPKRIIKPSLLVGEMFFPLSHDDNSIIDIVEKAGEIEFYKAVETGLIVNTKSVQRLRRICENSNLRLTQWATYLLNREKLNLASVDKDIRQKSIQRVKELVHIAAECGAKTFALISGDDPGAEKREEAKKCLADSLSALCTEAQKYQGMDIMLEHLDRYVHKKQLMGPVDETVVWLKEIRREYPNIYLSWDAAHVALGGENLGDTLHCAAALMPQMHLSNAILNPADPLYGDNHIKFGPPGFLTMEVAVDLLKTASHLDTLKDRDGINVSMEVRTKVGDDLWANEQEARAFLQEAIELATTCDIG